jgi:hypothetical protein
MMATLLTPSCLMPLYQTAVKMKTVAKATPAVKMKTVNKATPVIPFSIKKARNRSGELAALWVYPGELSRFLLACFRRQ